MQFHPRTEFKSCRYCLSEAKDRECILDGKYCPYKTSVNLESGDMKPMELVDQMLRE